MKTINVKSVNGYFSLPKNEREWLGFYIKPNHLPSELLTNEKGWDFFHEQIKKQYPVQWFFREWFFSFENPIYLFLKETRSILSKMVDKTKSIIKPFYPRWRKTLSRGEYLNSCDLFVQSSLNIIVDFYFEEASKSNFDWKYNKENEVFYEKLSSYVKWIESDRHEMKDIKNNFLKEKAFSEYDDVDKKIQEKETEILKWFTDNRHFFWN